MPTPVKRQYRSQNDQVERAIKSQDETNDLLKRIIEYLEIISSKLDKLNAQRQNKSD